MIGAASTNSRLKIAHLVLPPPDRFATTTCARVMGCGRPFDQRVALALDEINVFPSLKTGDFSSESFIRAASCRASLPAAEDVIRKARKGREVLISLH
jgi:hypothetical protein